MITYIETKVIGTTEAWAHQDIVDSELDIMITYIETKVIGTTEARAHQDIVDSELALTSYIMFRKD